MMRVAVAVLCLTVSGLLAQPVPSGDKNSTMEHGSPLNLEASKIVESGVAETVLSYGRPAYAPNYEARSSYSSPYPTSTCHGHAHGYYGNPAHGCKIFHICQEDGRLETFDCPPYTKFNNYLLVCDWPHKVDHNCDPVYKDEEYPPQSYNNAYPMDKTYAPNFMNLYPVKPAYNPLSYTPIIPAFAKGYTPVKAYAPYVPEYNPYKVEVYPKAPAVYSVHEKMPYKSYAEKSYDYPVDKVNYQAPKPHYPAEKMMYEKPAAYPLDKPVYDRPAAYPMERPAYEKSAYPMEKPVYDRPAAYPVEKQGYNVYPLDKPVYPVEKQQYVAPYPMEKPAYVQYDKPAYSAYPHQSPEYTIIVDKIVYSVEKPAYDKVVYPMDKPAYPMEKPVYEKPAYEKAVYPMEKPVYDKPVYERPGYPMERPVYDKPFYEKQVYDKPAYEKPAYDKPTYEKPAYDKPAYEKPAYDKPAYEKPAYDKPAYEKPIYDKPMYHMEKPQYNIYALEKPSYNAYPERTAYPMEKHVSYPETKVLYPLPLEKPAYQPEKPAYHVERPMYKEYVTKPIFKPSDYEKDLYKPDYQEKSYVLPLFPYNTYAAEYPSYDRPQYKQDKYPTVASFANYMKSYNPAPYAHEPQYGYAPVPYVSYRTRLAGLLKY